MPVSSRVLPVIALAIVLPQIANATEGGGSLYVPGLHGPMAGFTPPPAFYLANDILVYSGDFRAGSTLR